VEDVEQARATLQEVMTFLGAVASGIEDAVGNTANSVTYLAGKELGKRFSAGAARTDDLEAALVEVRRILEQNHCMWTFEPFKPKRRPSLVDHTADGDEVMLVFRDCMIRQSLFCFGHHQKGSVCTMMYGFFAGALENIMGRQSTLDIVHAGENACYKRLLVRPLVAAAAAPTEGGRQ
jgi:predicted hydrocarbon binding protein